MLRLLSSALELECDRASARNHYAHLVSKMKKVIKEMTEFKNGIISVAEKLKSKYRRFLARVDELSKILK